MNALNYVIVKMLILLSTPAFSFMLCEFFQKGMIFEFWGNFVNKEEYSNKDVLKKIQILEKELDKELTDQFRELVNNSILILKDSIVTVPFYKKPLGNCLKCFHVWIFFFFTALIFYTPIIIPIYLSVLGLSYLILNKL